MPEVIGWQLELVDRELAALGRLRGRLLGLSQMLKRSEAVNIDTFTALLKEMSNVEKYYTEEQLDTLAHRRDAYGDAQMAAFERQWTDLIARANRAKADGVDPASDEVLVIAREWSGLVGAFTGGDPGIHQSLERVWQEEDQVQGYDTAAMRDLMVWLSPAMEKVSAGTG